jgi:hypothetical protein
MEGSGSGKIITDTDPGDPKTNGSYGLGSKALRGCSKKMPIPLDSGHLPMQMAQINLKK